MQHVLIDIPSRLPVDLFVNRTAGSNSIFYQGGLPAMHEYTGPDPRNLCQRAPSPLDLRAHKPLWAGCVLTLDDAYAVERHQTNSLQQYAAQPVLADERHLANPPK